MDFKLNSYNVLLFAYFSIIVLISLRIHVDKHVVIRHVIVYVLVYKYWLLMKGMVENYCPRGEIQPWPTIHRGP